MEKNVVEMGRDFLADFIGFERGVFYTLKKLLSDPCEVVEAYKAKDSRICTPFSLIVLVFSLFFFVSVKIGLDSRFFAMAENLAIKLGTPEISSIASFIWSNLSYLLSAYVALTCGILSFFTRKLNLSFYDHVVANLYFNALGMVLMTLLVSVLPLINYDYDIFNIIGVAVGLVIIKLKKVKLRLYFYYPEEVRKDLKKPMLISGLFLGLLMSLPISWLVINTRF